MRLKTPANSVPAAAFAAATCDATLAGACASAAAANKTHTSDFMTRL
jgi:hypothetical protein